MECCQKTYRQKKSIYKQHLEAEKQLLKSCIYSKTFHSIHEGLYFIPAFAFTPVMLWMWYIPASGNPNDIHWAQMQTVLPRGKPQHIERSKCHKMKSDLTYHISYILVSLANNLCNSISDSPEFIFWLSIGVFS